jgi:hypothetical protein
MPVRGHADGRFSPSALSAIDAAARTATSVVDGRLTRLDRRVEVEEHPGVRGLLEVELLDLDLAARAVAGQWMRFIESPGAYGRTAVASGWSGACAQERRGRPRRWLVGDATSAARRRAGRRPGSRPADPADASKNPNGSPVRIISGSMRK